MQAVDIKQVEWVGAMELQSHVGGALQPWRLPRELLDFLDLRTRFQAGNPSGVRLRFASNTRRVHLQVEPVPEDKRWFDLLSNDQLAGRVELLPGDTVAAFEDLPPGEKKLEIWLNHMYAPVIVRGLQLDNGASFEMAPIAKKQRILFHGSSISHGRGAAGPVEAWPVGAARLLGLDPINFGFGGACRLEPAVARVIRDQAADFLSFCLGVNVVMGRTHNERAFRSAVVGFIQIVREKHAKTPLIIQGPIFCRQAETYPDPEQFSLVRCRQALREVVECFQKHGDKKIIYGGDLEMLGEADENMLCDGVHPGPEGHRLMARRYTELVWPRLVELALYKSD